MKTLEEEVTGLNSKKEELNDRISELESGLWRVLSLFKHLSIFWIAFWEFKSSSGQIILNATRKKKKYFDSLNTLFRSE